MLRKSIIKNRSKENYEMKSRNIENRAMSIENCRKKFVRRVPDYKTLVESRSCFDLFAAQQRGLAPLHCR